MEEIKLNLGASPNWHKSGWHVLDHKIKKTENTIPLNSTVVPTEGI